MALSGVGGAVLIAAVAAASAASSSCSRLPSAQHALQRVTSPDGVADVVVSEALVGATVSTPFEVFVVRKGTIPRPDDVVLRIDKSAEPKVAWLKPGTVEITCDGARVWHFQNFATLRLSEQKWWTASVQLACGQNGY
jgi:hypothetical protein